MRGVVVPLVVIALTAVAAADPAADAAARGLVDRWLASQNQSHYDDYAALYADAFRGTKRVGATTKAMDRAAWLKDRKTMFRVPMTVAIADVQVTAAPDAIVVELTQTWRQGDFADTGHKRLTLDAAGAHIVGEEMLDSHVLLTERACLGALYPGASWTRRRAGPDDTDPAVLAVTVLDLGASSVCQVDVKTDDGVATKVAAFHFQRAWQAAGHVDLTYPVEDTFHHVTGAVKVTPIELAAAETCVEVDAHAEEDGTGYAHIKDASTIYRVSATGLVEIMAMETDSESSDDGGDDTSCTLAIDDRVHGGWHDLVADCTTHHSGYRDRDQRTSTAQRRYTWDGAKYAISAGPRARHPRRSPPARRRRRRPAAA